MTRPTTNRVNGRGGQIRFRFDGGLSCPVFVCEVCNQSLDDPGWAWVVWDMKKEESGEYVLYPVHKRRCLDVLESRIEKADGGWLGSMELEEFLGHLTHNSGYEVAGSVERWHGMGDMCRLKRRER